MKIGQGINKPSSYKANNRVPVTSLDSNKNFSDFMQQKGREDTNGVLEKLLKEIDEQGKNLVTVKNLKQLKLYKSLIKNFMDEAVKAAILLDEQYSYDRVGRTRKYKIIRELDEKLIELTNLTLEKEVNQLQLLDQIGEIRGLLVNLYF